MIKLQVVLPIVLLSFASLTVSAQSRAEYLETYEKNIRREYLNDIYIPADVEEAISELKELSDPAGLEKFRLAPEDVISHKLHFGLGKWILTNWNLRDGSRYGHYLRLMGISHPDDQVQFTIVSLHRHLNGQDLDIVSRAQAYAKKREEEQRKRLKGEEVGG